MTSIAGPSKKMLNDERENIPYLSETLFSLLSSEVYEPTSTLQYVNSQLVAHGFAYSPGLSLDGLTIDDCERAVRCLLTMLSQRIEDLRRTEELGSKLRTISYEHERLQSMHRIAIDTGANAEREMNLFKSKMAASQRALTSEVSAHKQTLSELQRTRVSLQYLRATTQNELKRKDKEVERLLDRWNKVSDAQIKLTCSHSGLRCVNFVIGGEEHGKGKGLMEEALHQAEEARKELVRENEGFRSIILGTANELQGMVYNVTGLASDVHLEEPTPLSHTAVFAPPTSSLPHPNNAHLKLRELMTTLGQAVSSIPTSIPISSVKVAEPDDVTKLKDLVKTLRDELTQVRRSSNISATHAQEVLDKFTTYASERLLTGREPTPKEATEMSMELIGVLELDELRETLDRRAMELQMERDLFTEAAVKLGRDKAALERERLKLFEEKRRWAVDQMLADLPSTPGPAPVSSPRHNHPMKKHLSPSLRVRPRKVGGSKGTSKSPSKKTAVVESIPGAITSASSLSSKKRSAKKGNATEETTGVLHQPDMQQVNTMDTEYRPQRSTTPEDSPPVTPPGSASGAEMKTSLPLVLPTTFTLPPPSPASSLAALDLGSISPIASKPQTPPPSKVPSFDTIPLALGAHPPVISLARPHIFPSPRTPRPLVNTHLKHAYSPARPSPLSRILMIADSPPSPPPAPFIAEESTQTEGVAHLKSRTDIAMGALPKRTLTRGVKLEAPIDETNPLRELRGADMNGSVTLGTGVTGPCGESKLTNHGKTRFTAKEKGKGRAVSAANGVTAMEKENVATLTKESSAGRHRAFAINGATANTRVKPSKPAGQETQNTAVEVTTNHKPSSINETTGGAGTSCGPTKGSGVAPGGSVVMMTGVNMVRAGRARRVPVGSANASKLGAKKV